MDARTYSRCKETVDQPNRAEGNERENDDGLRNLSDGELMLLRDLVLMHLDSHGGDWTPLLRAVWQSVETECRSRIAEVRELERLYFRP